MPYPSSTANVLYIRRYFEHNRDDDSIAEVDFNPPGMGDDGAVVRCQSVLDASRGGVWVR